MDLATANNFMFIMKQRQQQEEESRKKGETIDNQKHAEEETPVNEETPVEERNPTVSSNTGSSSTAAGLSTTTATTTMSFYDNPRFAKNEVLYFVDDEITGIDYTTGHLMRPVRLRLLHSLIMSLKFDELMTVCKSKQATPEDLLSFHPSDYVSFLRNAKNVCEHHIDPCNQTLQREYGTVANTEGDCPLFPEVWTVIQSYCGASLACADALLATRANNGNGCKVAINWAGGLHHAAATNASGFCYANDICLCINRLLKSFYRVLYIDIDVHHGDGVEAAYAEDRRVMTLSLHQFGNGFFPGTGDLDQTGTEHGKGFAVNVPLPPRIDDAFYQTCFDVSLHEIMHSFAPEAIVLQCGADSVYGDLIGGLHVSSKCHARCVEKVLSYNLPTVMLGGGGYNVTQTALTWLADTAAVLGVLDQLPTHIPSSDPYYGYYRQRDPLRQPHIIIEPPHHVLGSSASTSLSSTHPPSAVASLPHSIIPVPTAQQSVGCKSLHTLLGRLLPLLEAQMASVKAWRLKFTRPVDPSSVAQMQALFATTTDQKQGSSKKRNLLVNLAALKRKRFEEQQRQGHDDAILDDITYPLPAIAPPTNLLSSTTLKNTQRDTMSSRRQTKTEEDGSGGDDAMSPVPRHSNNNVIRKLLSKSADDMGAVTRNLDGHHHGKDNQAEMSRRSLSLIAAATAPTRHSVSRSMGTIVDSPSGYANPLGYLRRNLYTLEATPNNLERRESERKRGKPFIPDNIPQKVGGFFTHQLAEQSDDEEDEESVNDDHGENHEDAHEEKGEETEVEEVRKEEKEDGDGSKE